MIEPQPFVIAVAPNGARRTHADHPALPITPQEIAGEARRCVDAGASVLHLHVRDDDGRHSLDADRYRAAIAAVRDAVGDRMIIQVTTEQVGRYTSIDQIALLRELRPQAASLAVTEILDGQVPQSEVAAFLQWTQAEHIALQYIVYSAEQAHRLVALQREGVVPQSRPGALFVLGRYTTDRESDPRALLAFLAAWPPDWPWSLCAFGAAEARCAAAAVTLGGHARVGFENNLRAPNGEMAQSNADSVANLARLAPLIGRPVASAAQAREIYAVSRD